MVLFQNGQQEEAFELLARPCLVETYSWNDMKPVVTVVFRTKLSNLLVNDEMGRRILQGITDEQILKIAPQLAASPRPLSTPQVIALFQHN